MSQRAHVTALEQQLAASKRQNARMRAALLHDCAICRICRCPERQKLFNDAFSRQLQTLRVEDRA